MIPTSDTFNSVLEKAKADSKVQQLLRQRDGSPNAYMRSITMAFVKRQGDAFFFSVTFEYLVKTPEMEANDDVRVVVPWNGRTNQFGQVSEPQLY